MQVCGSLPYRIPFKLQLLSFAKNYTALITSIKGAYYVYFLTILNRIGYFTIIIVYMSILPACKSVSYILVTWNWSYR